MSLLGIAGTLAAVGAGYADKKSADKRRERQDKYDKITDQIYAKQLARMSNQKSSSGPERLGMSDSEIANYSDYDEDQMVPMARGGMVGYANSANQSESGHPCYFVDHTWMSGNFKK
jgi:hypothetical protein